MAFVRSPSFPWCSTIFSCAPVDSLRLQPQADIFYAVANQFPCMFLSIATSVPWILYYVCALHSVHFLMITVFGLLGGFGNSPCCNRLPGVSRITPSEGQRTVCTAFMWVFGLCCFAGSIELVWNKQLWPGWVAPALRWTLGQRFAAYFEYRTYKDRFSSLPGLHQACVDAQAPLRPCSLATARSSFPEVPARSSLYHPLGSLNTGSSQ